MQNIIYVFLGFFFLVLAFHTVLRIISYFYKFPLPPYLAKVIDHPIRHKIHPPNETAIRHQLEPGMTVLEVGPGNGTYTLSSARRIGDKGKVVAVDIELRMIEFLRRNIQKNGVTNIESLIADVHTLPFEDDFFDVAYLMTVIGEIPDPKRAVQEFHRVLSPSGLLVFTEMFIDPDYPQVKTLVQMVTPAGFHLRNKIGNFLYYTLIFDKKT